MTMVHPLVQRRTSLLLVLLLVFSAMLSLPQPTQAGNFPTLVKNVNPFDPFEVGGTLYFTVLSDGNRLWRSDGTEAGTTPVPGIPAGNLSNFIVVDTTIYFQLFSNGDGDLWRTDGTAAGTSQVSEVVGDVGIGFNGKLYFSGPRDTSTGQATTLWRSDGTSAGTQPVSYPGSAADQVREFAVMGNSLYFIAYDPEPASENDNRNTLYRSDGTGAGTSVLLEIEDSSIFGPIRNMAAVGNTLFFAAGVDNTQLELWKTDGTVAGTTAISSLPDAASGFEITIQELTNVNGTLFFVVGYFNIGDAEPKRYEVWRSNGTSAGTQQVSDLNGTDGGYGVYSLTAIGDQLYFVTNEPTTGNQLWRTDGTTSGTTAISYLSPSFVFVTVTIAESNGKVYFPANRDSAGFELWQTDGTSAGTTRVTDLNPGSADGASANSWLINYNNEVYFAGNNGSGFGLWKLVDQAERVTDGLLAFYDFEEGSGNTIRDTSGVGTALNLRVARSFTHQWVEGGLRLKGLTVLRTNGAASKIIQAARTTNALTIEAWVTPADVEQFSSRIITVSPNTTVRNFSLNQGSFKRQDTTEALFVLRTTFSASTNAGLEFTSGSGALHPALTHLTVTVRADGTVAIYVDGELVRTYTNPGTLANWNTSYPLLLGNEALGGRGWKGTYYLVAFYNRALSASEVQQNFNAGP
jgi:ELWxxDGT repeat protein